MKTTMTKSHPPRIVMVAVGDEEEGEDAVIVKTQDVVVVLATIVTVVECLLKIGIEVHRRDCLLIFVIVDLHHRDGMIGIEDYLHHHHHIMVDATVVVLVLVLVLVVLHHEEVQMIGDPVLLIQGTETCGNGIDSTTDEEMLVVVAVVVLRHPQDTVVEAVEDQVGDHGLDHVAVTVPDLLGVIQVIVDLHHDQGQDRVLDQGHPVVV
mmetsp:Transcript_11831/g.16773  ORF Transcript_11831/g.16773 Transcript_11831/m.16773 type:complete len:208 (+) Transcript_11831:433-1056(+)